MGTHDTAQALPGGNMGGAVRVGDTVRKPRGPQSVTVQRLAAHVRAQGVTWIPEPLGVDDLGRDVWGLIPGDVSHDDPHDGYLGPRLWDLAYTAYRYVPLTPVADPAVLRRRLRRLGAFLADYAAQDAGLLYPTSGLLGFAVARLIAMVEWCEQQESPDRQRDAVVYRSHAEWIAAGGYGSVDAVTVADPA